MTFQEISLDIKCQPLPFDLYHHLAIFFVRSHKTFFSCSDPHFYVNQSMYLCRFLHFALTRNGILFPEFFCLTVRNIVLGIEKIFWNSKLKAENLQTIKITRTIYSNTERPIQFLKQNTFSTCSWRFLWSDTLEQLRFKLEKLIGI